MNKSITTCKFIIFLFYGHNLHTAQLEITLNSHSNCSYPTAQILKVYVLNISKEMQQPERISNDQVGRKVLLLASSNNPSAPAS